MDGTLVSERINGNTYYPLHDGNGSIVGLTDSSGGTLLDQCSYDPQLNATCGAQTVPNRFMALGLERSSSTGLYNTGNGSMDPAVSRPAGSRPICHDRGWADTRQNEDRCGEDEPQQIHASNTVPNTARMAGVTYCCTLTLYAEELGNGLVHLSALAIVPGYAVVNYEGELYVQSPAGPVLQRVNISKLFSVPVRGVVEINIGTVNTHCKATRFFIPTLTLTTLTVGNGTVFFEAFQPSLVVPGVPTEGDC